MRFFKVSASMGEFVVVEAGADIKLLNVSHSSNNVRQRNNIHTLCYKFLSRSPIMFMIDYLTMKD